MNDVILIIGIVATILAGVLLVALFRTRPEDPDWKKKLKSKLYELNKETSSNDPKHLKHMIIELDKLLDFTLKNSGFDGASMGERLKHAKTQYEWDFYNKIWMAHKARNSLVHDLDTFYTSKQLRNFATILKRAISEVI